MAISRKIIKSIIGGFLIGLGGTVFLSVEDKTIGAFLFSLGLLSICLTDQYLFTGKVSYSQKIPLLVLVLVGNYIGASGLGWLIHFIKPELSEKALIMCQNKLSERFLVIPLGFLCNILIYFAVEGAKKHCYILLILCVMAFILCGFEHCIANMFYFSAAGLFNLKYILLNVLGNALGGIVVYNIRKIVNKE